MFVFLGSLSLTNLLLCLLEIGDTFLTEWEALCLMELSEKVRAGAFLEQTNLTLHHNLQAEKNHRLQIVVGTVTRAICIRPSLNNPWRADEYKGGLALISFDHRSTHRKKLLSIYMSKTLCLLQLNCYFHLSLITWYLLTLRQPFARLFRSKANLLRHLALPE